jgi:hypothetical protein
MLGCPQRLVLVLVRFLAFCAEIQTLAGRVIHCGHRYTPTNAFLVDRKGPSHAEPNDSEEKDLCKP